jgi:hypothetical protein
MSPFLQRTIAIAVTLVVLHSSSNGSNKYGNYGVIAMTSQSQSPPQQQQQQQRQNRIPSSIRQHQHQNQNQNQHRSLVQDEIDSSDVTKMSDGDVLRWKNRNYQETEWIPPWVDAPVSSPTLSFVVTPTTPSPVVTTTASPTKSPTTNSPTKNPTASPSIKTTSSPTRSPTVAPVPVAIVVATTVAPVPVSATTTAILNLPVSVPTLAPQQQIPSGPAIAPTEQVVLNTTIYENNGGIETSCMLLPSIGTYVTEIFDIEYFLYLGGENSEETIDIDDVQNIVDSLVEPKLHNALVDNGMGCRGTDFVSSKHTMIYLSSNGRDTVSGTRCPIDEADEFTNPTATSCYQVWGQLEATMWFSPSRRLRQLRQRQRQRHLQQNGATPFGDREAYNEFVSWMEDSFNSLTDTDNTDAAGAGVLQVATFKGFVNINGFDGTVMEQPQDVGITPTAAFIGSSYAQANDGGPINITFGLIIIVAGVLVLSFVVFFVIMRRKKNRRSYKEHTKCIDELELDSEDDMEYNPNVVNDEDLFQEDRPLPAEYNVTMENADHDYRTCANPSCKACLERKDPIFIATEKNIGFLENLSVLRDDKYKLYNQREGGSLHDDTQIL